MKTKKTRGLVIKNTPIGEHDSLLTIFSENGKFRAVAKGARTPRNRLSAATRLFSWSEFVYYPSSKLARINEASLITAFDGLEEDLTALTYASYSLDLINHFYELDQVDKLALKLIIYYLHTLEEKKSDPLVLTLSFQIKLLKLAGLLPDFNILKDDVRFSVEEGFVKTEPSDPDRLERETKEILLYLYQKPINKLTRDFTESIDKLRPVFFFFNSYIEKQLEKHLDSFRILKEII